MTGPFQEPELTGGGALPGLEDPSDLPVEEVQELLQTFQKALRAYQLYDQNNPVYKRFVSSLRDGLSHLWDSVERLHLMVEEDRLIWLGEEVYRNENRSESLAFLLHKDGIRDVTLLPGLEEEELESLLEVLHQARNVRQEGDDLVTILWDRDLQLFRHSYVDYAAEGLDLPEAEALDDEQLQALVGGEVSGLGLGEAEVEGEEEEGEGGPGGGGAPSPAGTVNREDFNPTLYALDSEEERYLQEELEKEFRRDLRDEVLSALFDRLEEPEHRDRQEEILEILRTLLPSLLGHGALKPAARVVEELLEIRNDRDVLDKDGWEMVEQLVEDLSSAEVVGELIQGLEEGAIPPRAEELALLFRHLRMGALPPLLRSVESSENEEVAEVLQGTVADIARQQPEGLLRALGSSDPLVVAGAARVAGEMQLQEAASHLSRLFKSESPAVRLAAARTAGRIPSSVLANAAQQALEDENREVRIEAARALTAVEYAPSAKRFEEIVTGKAIREADITEKIAFFEAYGLLGGEEAVKVLDKLLNGRSLLRRKEPSELRAAAALALGRSGRPSARRSLEKADGDSEPVVRSAVNRALKGEVSA